MNHKFEPLILSPQSTLRDALAKIAKNKPGKTSLPAGIVLILDESEKLLGIATDGDIRRAVTAGAGLDTPITRAMNKKPFLIEGPMSHMNILSLVVEKIKKENWHKDRLDKIIVVDKKQKILDLLSFYDLWQQSDTRFKHIGIVGLGFVGLTLGLTLADLGFTVRGFDKNKKPFLIEGPMSHMNILSLVVEKIKKENWHKDRLDKIIVVDKKQKILDLLSFYDLWQQSDTRFKHIGIVGLGFVGLTLGLTLADLGFTVRGFDKNKKISQLIVAGKPPFFEAGMPALLKDHLGNKFLVVNNFKRENNCDVYFIAVGTPLGNNNKPDLKYLGEASKNLGKILKRGDSVILRSTVPMGTTRNFVIPLLEKNSNLKAGEDFFVAFAPERTVEGKALEELRRLPQVIGGINHHSVDQAANIFGFMTKATVLVDTLEEAEMVKLINNTYRDVTFGFANEVSLIASRWGMDAKRVIEAANYGYERSAVPMPSPGVGGYCLEKDPYIFIDSALAKGYDPLLFRHARKISDTMINHVAENISSFLKNKSLKKNPKILALGVAFKGKPVTSDVRGSTTVKIINKLQRENYKNIHGFDPAVSKENVLAQNIKHVKDIKAGFAKADVVFVGTNHPDFEGLSIRNLLSLSERPVLLYDAWGLFNKEEISKLKGVHYLRL